MHGGEAALRVCSFGGMSTDRYRFLFGSDVAPVDVDLDDQLIALLRARLGQPGHAGAGPIAGVDAAGGGAPAAAGHATGDVGDGATVHREPVNG